MDNEEKHEKKVEIKEKPPGGTERVERTEAQTSERPSTAARPPRAESMARKSGEAVGAGLKKIATVLGEFSSGISREMRPRKPPAKEQQAQRIEQQPEQGEEAQGTSNTDVTDKEKIERKTGREETK